MCHCVELSGDGYDLNMPVYAPEINDSLGAEKATTAICLELEQKPITSWACGSKGSRVSWSFVYFRGESLVLHANLLRHRIRKRTRSINRAALPADEFAVRLLRLPDVHADLGESGLPAFHAPLGTRPCTGPAITSRDRAPGRGVNGVHPGENGTSGVNMHDSRALKEGRGARRRTVGWIGAGSLALVTYRR